jgi:hypothetical protein
MYLLSMDNLPYPEIVCTQDVCQRGINRISALGKRMPVSTLAAQSLNRVTDLPSQDAKLGQITLDFSLHTYLLKFSKA